MSILSDVEIEERGIISPFEPGRSRPGVISYGLTSYGYDARVGYKFKVFTPAMCAEVDPKNFDPRAFVDIDLTPVHHDFIPGDNAGFKDQWDGHCVKCRRRLSKENADDICWDKSPNQFIRIPPNSFALAETLETFKIPRDILAVVLGKSTYARCGVVVNVTPLEPEWRGKVTIEISNTTPLPARIYAGEGIMQVLFFRADQVCRTSYADKKGKYQNQTGLTLPKVDGSTKGAE